MKNHSKSFTNKVVMITGASSGIGQALALQLATEKAKLALLARRSDRLESLVSDCLKNNTQAIAITADVTSENDLPQAVNTTHEKLGLIDVVIANAGYGVIGRIDNLKLEDYRRQFETNVFGVLKTIYACLDDLKKTKGNIVLVGSALGHITLPDYTAYSMSKHAITSLARSLYMELNQYGIGVTLVSPGYITTEFRNINNQGVYETGLRKPAPKWLSMSPNKAAKIIIEATRRRQRECIFTLPGRFGVLLNRFFPGLIPWYFK